MGKNIYTDGKYLENNQAWHTEDSAWKTKQILKIIEKNNLSLARSVRLAVALEKY